MLLINFLSRLALILIIVNFVLTQSEAHGMMLIFAYLAYSISSYNLTLENKENKNE